MNSTENGQGGGGGERGARFYRTAVVIECPSHIRLDILTHDELPNNFFMSAKTVWGCTKTTKELRAKHTGQYNNKIG